MSDTMLPKRALKTVLEALTNNYLYRRSLRLLAEAEVEIQLLSILCDREKLSLDIGANRGLYIHHLLPNSKQVIAFEPLLPMQELLRKIYRKRIMLEPVALSDFEGEIELRYPVGNYSWATIEGENTLDLSNVTIRTDRVKTRMLDSYSLDGIGFVKIDVEGHEEAVLRGALDTLKRTSPILLIEIEERHKSGAVARVASLLESQGNECHFISHGRLHSIDEFQLARDQAIENVGVEGKNEHYINNFIFIPRQKADKITADIRATLSRLFGPK